MTESDTLAFPELDNPRRSREGREEGEEVGRSGRKWGGGGRSGEEEGGSGEDQGERSWEEDGEEGPGRRWEVGNEGEDVFSIGIGNHYLLHPSHSHT